MMQTRLWVWTKRENRDLISMTSQLLKKQMNKDKRCCYESDGIIRAKNSCWRPPGKNLHLPHKPRSEPVNMATNVILISGFRQSSSFVTRSQFFDEFDHLVKDQNTDRAISSRAPIKRHIDQRPGLTMKRLRPAFYRCWKLASEFRHASFKTFSQLKL